MALDVEHGLSDQEEAAGLNDAAIEFFNETGGDGMTAAIVMLQRATALDPRNALIHANLGSRCGLANAMRRQRLSFVALSSWTRKARSIIAT